MKLIVGYVGIFALSLMGLASPAFAQGYPSRPIRVIVPFPAGGPSDVGMRLIAQKMTESMGVQVLVDNRPGANTIIGAEAVAKAAPDGYTLLCAIDSTLTMNQFMYSKLPYDPIKDFAPVTSILWSPVIVVVDAATGPKSVKELLQEARTNPGKLNFGSGTVATRLIGEQIKSRAAIVDRLNQEIRRALAMPDVIEKLSGSGLEPMASTPTEFAAFIKKEAERAEPAIRKAGIRLD